MNDPQSLPLLKFDYHPASCTLLFLWDTQGNGKTHVNARRFLPLQDQYRSAHNAAMPLNFVFRGILQTQPTTFFITNIVIFACLVICSGCAPVVTGAVVGAMTGAMAGSGAFEKVVLVEELNPSEIRRIEFKDREFIETKLTDKKVIGRFIEELKMAQRTEATPGNYYKTIEIAFEDNTISRIGFYQSFLKVGDLYYTMEKPLNEKLLSYY